MRTSRSLATVLVAVGVFAFQVSAAEAAGPTSQTASHALSPSPDNYDPLVRELTLFDHAVSLEDASTISHARGGVVVGYSLSSDSVVGDYWLTTSQTMEEYLASVQATLNTQPEVIGAYTLQRESIAASRRGVADDVPTVLETHLPEFDAPPGRLTSPPRDTTASARLDEVDAASSANAVPFTRTWAPNNAQIEIYNLTSTTMQIKESFNWFSSSPFNAPYIMDDHWGMEFQLDFYTANRAWPPGTPINFPGKDYRPNCSQANYKDWAAASNDVFNWYALVYVDDGTLYTPADLGFYGDYNDLSDECTRSSVTVGMANPQIYPSTGNFQFLDLYLFPDSGQDSTSPVSGVVQAVDRDQCEVFPNTPLTDCMGAMQKTYSGDGGGSRPLLARSRGWIAPALCWQTDGWGLGDIDPFNYPC